MQKKIIGAILLVMFIAASSAMAQVSIIYSTGGTAYFTMAVANDWKVNVGSDRTSSEASEETRVPARIISAMPNDGMPLWFGMWVPEELTTIENAKEYMNSLSLDLLDDVVVSKRNFDTLHSMEVFYVGGTGKKENQTMDFRAAFIQLSEEKVIVAIYIGPAETTKAHGHELLQMVHSIQPVSP
jgi:hypothetical protein